MSIAACGRCGIVIKFEADEREFDAENGVWWVRCECGCRVVVD